MNPEEVFCPNGECPARGQRGEGNIWIHSQKKRRYKCKVCGTTFSETTGTALYRLHTALDIVVLVVTLLAHGCPRQAIVAAFGLDERTVAAWEARAGRQCEAIHHHLVEVGRDLGQVQADEVWIKAQGKRLWIALAMQVQTRLWLGGEVSEHRDTALITKLVQTIRACALCRPLLISVDGLATYVSAILTVFREPLLTGERGRPRLRPWDDLCIGQVLKGGGCHGKAISYRIVQGSAALVKQLLGTTQGPQGVLNTAFIERFNGTFRARLAPLARRTRALARQTTTLRTGMYLVGTFYNFCTDHESLRLPGLIGGRKWLPRTPAMAAGLTDHRWSVAELLAYRVPPPRWQPLKRRGRRSAHLQRLIDRWAA
jgi:transposase-like protein